jgi:hypothetical protein
MHRKTRITINTPTSEHYSHGAYSYHQNTHQQTHPYTIQSITIIKTPVGRESSVGIANRYGLDGPRIESRWGREFQHPSRPELGPIKPPIYNEYRVFHGVRRPGRGLENAPSSGAEVKERVELYIYFHSGPPWHVLGRTLTLSIYSLRPLHVPAAGAILMELQNKEVQPQQVSLRVTVPLWKSAKCYNSNICKN